MMRTTSSEHTRQSAVTMAARADAMVTNVVSWVEKRSPQRTWSMPAAMPPVMNPTKARRSESSTSDAGMASEEARRRPKVDSATCSWNRSLFPTVACVANATNNAAKAPMVR